MGPSTIGTLLERADDGKVRFTAAMDKLHELLTIFRPVMLIVDPLAELHNCEENGNTALRAIIAKFRELAVEFDMAVVVLHHTRKGADNHQAILMPPEAHPPSSGPYGWPSR
jgi:RecA-family ATPase